MYHQRSLRRRIFQRQIIMQSWFPVAATIQVPVDCLDVLLFKRQWKHYLTYLSSFIFVLFLVIHGVESRLVFKQPTSWRPCISRDIMVSVASEMLRESPGPNTAVSQLPVQVCFLSKQSQFIIFPILQCINRRAMMVPVLLRLLPCLRSIIFMVIDPTFLKLFQSLAAIWHTFVLVL